MCLKVTFPLPTKAKALAKFKPLTAKKDIVVYKILRVELGGIQKEEKINWVLKSPFRETTYTFGELKKAKFTTGIAQWSGDGKDLYALQIYSGLHAFTKSQNIEVWEGGISSEHYTFLQFKCIIPKGSKYIVNFNGREIVSESLRLPTLEKQDKLKPAGRRITKTK
jgi:hypothetical protein